MKKTVVLLAIVAVLATAPVAPAHAEIPGVRTVKTFFSDFFSVFARKNEDDPALTGLAPFADPGARPTTPLESANSLPINKASLDKPHRSGRDLEEWVAKVLSEILSFDSVNYDSYVQQILPRAFAPSGLGEFQNWVNSTGIITALNANGMQLNGFVTETPFLLNEGSVNGRYRWLYEVSLMLSFVPRGTTSYTSDLAVDTRKLIITVQLGRSTSSTTEHQVLIETWAVKDDNRRN